MAEGDRGLLKFQAFLLRSPCMDLLRLTLSELHCLGRSSKGPRDIQEGTELPGIRVWDGKASFSQTELLTKSIVPFLSPPRRELAGRHHFWASINLAHTVHSTLVICWDPAPPNLQAYPSCFQFYHTNGLSWLMLQTFLKSPKQTASGLRMLPTSP